MIVLPGMKKVLMTFNFSQKDGWIFEGFRLTRKSEGLGHKF